MSVDQFIACLSLEDRMFLANQALTNKEVLKTLVNEIVNGPDKPCYHEARKTLLDHMPEVHQSLVRGLLSVIEVQNRRLHSANDRAAKLWYGWPKNHIGERPKDVLNDPAIHVTDEDVSRIIHEYFERKAEK
jgi:hypothetical protein